MTNQPIWLDIFTLSRVIRCLLYYCFLLILIKSLFFFIHTKIARYTNDGSCLLIEIRGLAKRHFNTGKKPVRLFGTVTGCWARSHLIFPAFWTRLYLRANISSSLSVDKLNYSVEPSLVFQTFQVSSFWSSKFMSTYVGAFMVLHKLKSFSSVECSARLGSDFVF